MKVTSDNGFSPLAPLRNTRPSQTTQVGDVEKADKVEFSAVLQGIRQPQTTESSSRSEKVESLKADIADGNYHPDLKQVAVSFLKAFITG
ncbi:MAG: flagellar biosynthesis anti-sigma factor FlgM [Deltaproteobacteria bacterium]|nr:flagellar biosynthesis anti-sigma factor FlgM [Deltaproteobacteria bacterium]